MFILSRMRRGAVFLTLSLFWLSFCWISDGLALTRSEYEAMPATGSGDILFYIDAVSFYYDESENFEEISCVVPNDQIRFEKYNGSFKGSLSFSVDIIDEKGTRVSSTENKVDVVASSTEDAKDRSIVQLLKSTARVRPGNYTVRVTLEDLNAIRPGLLSQVLRRHKKGIAELLVQSPDFARQGLSISDIEFARGLRRKSYGDFEKSGFEILPNPQRLYGLLLPEVAIYAEIYRFWEAADTDSAKIIHRIADRQGATIFERSSSIGLKNEVNPHTALFDITSLASGSYSMSITVIGPYGESVSRRRSFDVVWSLLSWGRYDYETLGDIEYIMTDAEMAEFQSLSPGEREAYLESFWSRLDPAPESPENEVREEHYRRVVYADKHFSTSTTRGALTDRGRIYIKYGPPDDIESHYSNMDFVKSTRQMEGTDSPVPTDPYRRAEMKTSGLSGDASVTSEIEALTGQTGGVSVHGKSYEIWRYDGEGKPLRRLHKRISAHPTMVFILVDERGIGDYRIVYSTERGEY